MIETDVNASILFDIQRAQRLDELRDNRLSVFLLFFLLLLLGFLLQNIRFVLFI